MVYITNKNVVRFSVTILGLFLSLTCVSNLTITKQERHTILSALNRSKSFVCTTPSEKYSDTLFDQLKMYESCFKENPLNALLEKKEFTADSTVKEEAHYPLIANSEISSYISVEAQLLCQQKHNTKRQDHQSFEYPFSESLTRNDTEHFQTQNSSYAQDGFDDYFMAFFKKKYWEKPKGIFKKLRSASNIRASRFWLTGDCYKDLLYTTAPEVSELIKHIDIVSNVPNKQLDQSNGSSLKKAANPFFASLFSMLLTYNAEPVSLMALTDKQKKALRPLLFNTFKKDELSDFEDAILNGAEMTSISTNPEFATSFMQHAFSDKRFFQNLYFLIDTKGYDHEPYEPRHHQFLWIHLSEDQILLGMHPSNGFLMAYAIKKEYRKKFLFHFFGLIFLSQTYHVSDKSVWDNLTKNKKKQNTFNELLCKRIYMVLQKKN